MLNEKELIRYDRQIMIFGKNAQEKLKKAKVATVGIGGLGSAISIYLTAAGVGHLLLIDEQKPELSNLNRQILYGEEDVEKRAKTISAKEKLNQLNSEVKIETYSKRISRENIEDLLDDVDIVVDALDNFETRYLLNEFCVKGRMPLVHAAVEGFHGQITTIIPGKTPCLRCLFPNPPREIKFPIIGVTAGFFGILEANEVLKLITGYGNNLIGKLFIYDLSRNEGEWIDIRPNPSCPLCSNLHISEY
ncbi:MAG: ThiF family adenylyltransferase [Candidatus Aerophobetes bacterium]|nr:ThiF family adenylyltransferase [Candidatus Aerophobetes bacterium]